MEVSLKYGAGVVQLSVRDELVAGPWSLARAVASRRSRPRAELAEACAELDAAGFREAVRGRRLGLLVADGTRGWDPARVFLPLRPALAEAGRVDAFLCTGTHDPSTPENRAMAARVEEALAGLPPAVRVLVHDGRRDPHRDLGRTSRGTRVEVLEDALACEAFLVVADMKHHYFAGYSNPVKYFVPGVASIETARGNHSLALEDEAAAGRHPWHPDPDRRSNPLAEDMVEALGMLIGGRPHHALVMISSEGEFLWAGGGRTEEVSGRGMRAVDELASLEVEPVRFLVVSAGGAPLDESLYTAQRALELSRDAVVPGGEVCLLARCSNGLGPPGSRENFVEPLARPLDEVVAVRREDYVLYGHKPVKLARILRRLSAVHLLSDLPAEEVRRIHMRPVDSLQAVVDGWAGQAAPGERIGFLDDASKLVVVPPSQVPMPK